ncbi:hypothetical protein GUITHDRAFT_106839 [Guillardia theta CCMP2712]|uniref:Uncharacterized protein n=2 Tax=Guillardia theta TaxID=55529 RepID=L1JFV2_GUITC|nr:hypothetical protein GUITHDRAFT_106839 [Guillardia theta CCMP2712]EKX47393.1 hypothetical protein GUITHDRAFT_106839 [Guillardia theta CCMP2712]|eukprot:XP_005834373.1 hypothetical protein GUITHDRAFT_106839 [Guillardia theta CCMP2712]
MKSRTRLGRKCAHPEGCDEASTRVVYGFLDNDTRFCKMHRCPDHRDLSNKKKICSFKGCLKYATFGQERSSLELSMTDQNMFCKDHKPDDFVDVKNRMCKFGGCRKRASYSIPGSRLWFCRFHKLSGTNSTFGLRICDHEGCSKVAHYGNMADKSRRWCANHRSSIDFDLHNRICEGHFSSWGSQDGLFQSFRCTRRAIYGSPEDRIRKFCSLHRNASHEYLNAAAT